MAKKKNKIVTVFAVLALMGIIISVIGTGIIVFMWPNHQYQNQERVFSQEELQKILQDSNINAEVTTESGEAANITIKDSTEEGTALTASGDTK